MHFKSFSQSVSGSVSAMTGASVLLLAMAVGGTVDITKTVNARAELQRAVDSATMAAATQTSLAEQEARFDAAMSVFIENHEKFTLVPSANNITHDGNTITGAAEVEIKLMFGNVVFGSNAKRLDARTSVMLENQSVEVALVVDVSSSMIEDGRFEPARSAIKSFVGKFADGEPTMENARIALVPFSSRINFGTSRPNIFGMWNGADAIPDRWMNPEDHHSAKWTLGYWIDNTTPRMEYDGYYRWMGCAEPRLDVAIEQGATEFTPNDAAPSDIPFIAMDHNPQPGVTFCPPPIQPLTDDKATLLQAADALSSQGTTRLDAGMAGGWYTLSQNWQTAWGSTHAPADYNEPTVSKVVVFMTDGGMNTMDDPAATEYDWVCKASGDCDDRAEATLLETCAAMKAQGIEIYSISYGEYADREFVRTCASTPGNYFVADSDEGAEDYIDTIYRRIAEKIKRPRPTMTQ